MIMSKEKKITSIIKTKKTTRRETKKLEQNGRSKPTAMGGC